MEQVHQDPTLCEFGFIAHEMGHGFGLPHSNSANPDIVYGDGFDLMSFRQRLSFLSSLGDYKAMRR